MPKQYVPVTKSPLEITIRKAAIGAKLAGAELAAFLAQCAHESAKFTTTKEFADGSQYEGRKDLGNVKPGDGVKYKGRGFLQITGRANYTQASKDLGIDLVNHPELAERPDIAIKVSLWYWKTRVQPKITNFTNTKAVTKKVNGGTTALQQRVNLTKSFQVANK
jgi:putative chitinase